MSKMTTQCTAEFDETFALGEAVFVTGGHFRGRIGYVDDNAWETLDDLMQDSDPVFEVDEAEWHCPQPAQFQSDEVQFLSLPLQIGTSVSVVYFGDRLQTRGHFIIPQSLLRIATMVDLVTRYSEIEQSLVNYAFSLDPAKDNEIVQLLSEKSFIQEEIRLIEGRLSASPRANANVFLCHASEDKPFVRSVHADLVRFGLKPWLDEFEIGIGESIVRKIEEGAKSADAIILFLSKASVEKAWVQKEWHSFLARVLSGEEIVFITAVIEDCEIPAILRDIKYADFRAKYHETLTELLAALPQEDNLR